MAVDYLSALNAGSGLNVTQIVDALVDAERVPKQTQIDDAIETANVQISALGTLKNELSVFQTNANTLDGETGLALSSSTSNVTLTRTDSSVASEFNHTINVASIATSQVLNFNNGGSGFTSLTSDIGLDTILIEFGTWSAVPAFTDNGDGNSTTLSLTAPTLPDVRDAINNAGKNLTASIIEVSTGKYSLMVKSPEGLDNSLRVTASDSGSAVNIMKYDPQRVSSLADTGTQVVAGANASFTIDGISISRDSNKIADLFSGVTLELSNVTAADIGTAQNITSSYDEADALTTLETVVSEINYLLTYLKEQTSPGNDGTDAGPLHGDHFLRYVQTKIKNLTSTEIYGYDDESVYLSNFGVVTQLDGTLTIDKTRFTEYFNENPGHFAAVTTTMIRTSDAGIVGSANTDMFTANSYTYDLANSQISQAANSSRGISSGTGTLSTGTNKFGYAETGIGATGLMLETTQTSGTGTIYMGRSVLNTLSKYIDDILLMNGEVDEKITRLEDDLDDLEDQQDSLDTTIASQRAVYVERFTAMETAVSSFRKTGEYLDNLIDSWNSN